MFIRKLRPEECAPTTANLVRIDRQVDGTVTWDGSIKVEDSPVHGRSGAKFVTGQEAEKDAKQSPK